MKSGKRYKEEERIISLPCRSGGSVARAGEFKPKHVALNYVVFYFIVAGELAREGRFPYFNWKL
jgi:hypothetical protein